MLTFFFFFFALYLPRFNSFRLVFNFLILDLSRFHSLQLLRGIIMTTITIYWVPILWLEFYRYFLTILQGWLSLFTFYLWDNRCSEWFNHLPQISQFTKCQSWGSESFLPTSNLLLLFTIFHHISQNKWEQRIRLEDHLHVRGDRCVHGPQLHSPGFYPPFGSLPGCFLLWHHARAPRATVTLSKVQPKLDKTPFSSISLTQLRQAGIFRKSFTKH